MKTARMIFQPTPASDKLLKGDSKANGTSISASINHAIKKAFTPNNEIFRIDAEHLIEKTENNIPIEQEEYRAVLARCVLELKNSPISDIEIITDIMSHFLNPYNEEYNYDYVWEINDIQDQILGHVKEILYSLDNNYMLWRREYGYMIRQILKYWNSLYTYPEVYIALSIIIEKEKIYKPLDFFNTLNMLCILDENISKYALTPSSKPYETDISLWDRYSNKRMEINEYLSDKAYVSLTGDRNSPCKFPEMEEYLLQMPRDLTNGTPTQEQILEIMEYEKRGRNLFRKIMETIRQDI